jgi:hypothetical protein
LKACQQTFLLGALLLLNACAIEPAPPIEMPTDAEVEQYNASVPPQDRIVCRDEVPVGTNIPQRMCRFIADIQANTSYTRSELMRVLR